MVPIAVQYGISRRSGCIPSYVGLEQLEVSVGGTSVILPALITEPRGISIERKLAQNGSTDLVKVGNALLGALKFIH